VTTPSVNVNLSDRVGSVGIYRTKLELLDTLLSTYKGPDQSVHRIAESTRRQDKFDTADLIAINAIPATVNNVLKAISVLSN